MKKSMFVMTIILLLSLVMATAASAAYRPELPIWEQVFDPVPIFGDWDFWIYGAEFKDKMYFGSFPAETGDQIWGTTDGDDWSLAWQASDIQEGFEGIWGPMFVFKDQLYLKVGDWDGEYPDRLVRTPNGKHWEVVATAEWAEDYWTFLTGFTSFQGALYLVNVKGTDEPLTRLTRLWRSTSGDPGTWEEVAQFPDWDPWGELSFATFKGALYVMSDYIWRNDAYAPAEIWRSFDGENWEQIVSDGFGDLLNIRGGSFGQKDGYLYASMGISDSASDIYRTQDGIVWEPVTLDGFDEPENWVFSSFVTYHDKIYVYGASFTGCRVYSSADGVNWTLVNAPGWGDLRNIGVLREYGRVIFKGRLYSGTIGPGGVYRLGKP